jgi:hypothetical protein
MIFWQPFGHLQVKVPLDYEKSRIPTKEIEVQLWSQVQQTIPLQCQLLPELVVLLKAD